MENIIKDDSTKIQLLSVLLLASLFFIIETIYVMIYEYSSRYYETYISIIVLAYLISVGLILFVNKAEIKIEQDVEKQVEEVKQENINNTEEKTD